MNTANQGDQRGLSDPTEATGTSPNELIKSSSRGLRGDIAAELLNSNPNFSSPTSQLLKFHGVYTQDDRDQRAQLRREGHEIAHICMVRVAVPGGKVSAEQYLKLDALATTLAGDSLRVTTRQGLQFHFVKKGDLKPVISAVNESLLSSYAGCGDVVRNVMACTAPRNDGLDRELAELSDSISKRYKPTSNAYFEIWSDGEKQAALEEEVDPIYGVTYLPRKFKIGVAVSDDNCIDILSHDLGVLIDAQRPDRFGIVVGGGLGRAHADPGTIARLAEPLCLVTQEQLYETIDAVIGIQRDLGNRSDRSRARLKYLIEELGIVHFRQLVQQKLGRDLVPMPDLNISGAHDHLGVHDEDFSRPYFGLKLPSGRIRDTKSTSLRSALATAVDKFRPSLSFTAREDLLVYGLDRETLEAFIREVEESSNRRQEDMSSIELDSFACPALPTCGLALAESERYLPTLISALSQEISKLGLAATDISLRMTGCPNGCARPYLAEIGIVGRSKRSYDIYLGADRLGTRLGVPYAQDVSSDLLVNSLIGPLSTYQKQRLDGEGFGDFCNRYGVSQLNAEFAPKPRRRRSAEVSDASK